MESSAGEYIKAEFTSGELDLISQRAEFIAQTEDINPFWKRIYWQLALVANHLSIMLEEEEKPEESILEKYKG